MINKYIFFISMSFFLFNSLKSSYDHRNDREIRNAIYYGDVNWFKSNFKEISFYSLKNIKNTILNTDKILKIIAGIPFNSSLWNEIKTISYTDSPIAMSSQAFMIMQKISSNMFDDLKSIINIVDAYANEDNLSADLQEEWFKSYVAERIVRNNDMIEIFQLKLE